MQLACMGSPASARATIGPHLRPGKPVPSHLHAVRPVTRFAERLRRILSSRGLTFAKLAREAERLLPNHPRCRIPRNFYNDVRTTALSPDIFQLFTLSAVSGYRLADWFSLFGFSPEEIPRLQLALPPKRTLLLDATHYLQQPDLAWSIPSHWNVPAVCPLVPFLRTLEVQRDKSPVPRPSERYLYARIGNEDALAFPDLLPGSLVRVDTRRAELHLPSRSGSRSRVIFLVEHARGLVCSRLLRIDHKRFALHTADLPYAQVPLEIGREANLLGVVDMELRQMRRSEGPVVPADLANFWKPEPLPPVRRTGELGNWIRASRTRSGLHFREASGQSAHIAELMRDARYLVASGSLSDYETTERPPRHVHKIFSLCALYGLSLVTFLEKSGLPLAQLGRDPFPENLRPRHEKDPPAYPPSAHRHAVQGTASLSGPRNGAAHRVVRRVGS